jgi:hypothetical protein
VNANSATTVAANYGSGYAIEVMREHMNTVLLEYTSNHKHGFIVLVLT